MSKALAKFTSIQICLATGGLELKSQEAALRKNPDIVVATPGRLVDFLHNTPSFGLQYVEILVLDEADRYVASFLIGNIGGRGCRSLCIVRKKIMVSP